MKGGAVRIVRAAPDVFRKLHGKTAIPTKLCVGIFLVFALVFLQHFPCFICHLAIDRQAQITMRTSYRAAFEQLFDREGNKSAALRAGQAGSSCGIYSIPNYLSLLQERYRPHCLLAGQICSEAKVWQVAQSCAPPLINNLFLWQR